MSTPAPAESVTSTCSVCACTSTWREAFKPVKDGARIFLCCPKCAPRKLAKTRNTVLVLLLGAAVLAITGLGHSNTQGTFFPAAALVLFFLFTVLLVPFHELGHVIAAKLVGAPAYAVIIGSEPWIIDREWAGVRWRVGKVPGGGLAYHTPCEGRSVRLRKISILLGGVAMNFAISVVACLLAKFLSREPDRPLLILALYVLAAASATQGVTNLWPRQFTSSVGRIKSDGAKILSLLRGAALDGGHAHSTMHFMRTDFAFADRDFARAAHEAALADRYLEAPALRDARAAMIVKRAAACAESDDAATTVALLEPLLAAEGMHPGVRSAVDDNLAWAYLLLDDPALIERALPLLGSARAVQPWQMSFAIAEACVLAASSDSANERVVQARQLLTSIERERLDRQNAAYTALAKGLCAAAEGDLDAAIRHRDVAKSLGATAAPLRVLERRFPSP